MNKLQLLQKTQAECIPNLSEAISQLRKVFPKFEIKPSILERTPNTDIFVTAGLEQDGANRCKMVNDYINTSTEKIRDRLTMTSYVNESQNIRCSTCQFEEFNDDVNVTKEVYYNSNGYVKGAEHKYDAKGHRIQTKEMFPQNKSEQITTLDANGKPTCVEKLYLDKSFANTKKVINPDGSYTRTVYQIRKVGKQQLKADTIEEYARNGKLFRITQTLNDEFESLIEFNSQGKIIKLDVPDLLANGKGHTRLKVEYASEHPYPNTPKSVEVANTDGSVIYKAIYKNGVPVEVSGSVVDKMKKEGFNSIDNIEAEIGTPLIVPHRGMIEYYGLDNYYPRIFWKENILACQPWKKELIRS